MARTVACAGAAVFFFSACAALPGPSQPSSLDHGLLIGRAFSHGALLAFRRSPADSGALVALDPAGAALPGVGATSRLSAGGYMVFVDLPPGRYALRTATFPSRGVLYRLRVPADGEAKRSVVLRPGTAAFLGVHAFDARWPDFGVAVGRAARIAGHWLTPWRRRPVLPRDADMSSFDNGPAAEIYALRAVRGALGGTQWERLVDARLRELGAPEPAKIEGALRPRELPLREEAILSWRDTLKWGEPRRGRGGLAWRRPGGEAQIAVFFTSASAPGYAGWDAAVGELRRAALASVEDTGEVYEVRVATRSGPAARATTYRYPEGTLVGSVTDVFLTETILVPDGGGMFTARLRAPRGEFEPLLPAYREFLLQLVLGPPKPKSGAQSELILPGLLAP